MHLLGNTVQWLIEVSLNVVAERFQWGHIKNVDSFSQLIV